MSYTCRVYSNSGFNAVNIPDNPALLELLPYVDYPALEVFQNRNLDHIDIKVTNYDQIKNADYCRVGDWFYFVDGIIMLCGDTARLSLIADFITSFGGVASLEILDGITNRVHVSDDSYGRWCEADPYMAPAEPLEEVNYLETPNPSQGQLVNNIVVKSTLDLNSMGDPSNTNEAIVYEDVVGGTSERVTVPHVEPNGVNDVTNYNIQGVSQNLPEESHTRLFNAKSANIKRGLSKINDLGVNGAVTAQVAYPTSYIELTETSTGSGVYTTATGKKLNHSITALPFEKQYTNALKNKKVYYSEYTPYGLITASGATKQYMPADLKKGLAALYPSLITLCDPRTDGKPYFRFEYLRGVDCSDISNFFKEAIAGMPWRQVPLIYEGATGKALAQLQFAQSMNRAAKEYDYAYSDLEFEDKLRDFTIIGNAASKGLQLAGGDMGGGILGALGDIGDIIQTGIRRVHPVGYGDVEGISLDMARLQSRYQQEKAFEQANFMANTQIYTPKVDFPFSADLFNDLYTNPCYCYRLYYSENDAYRIDKILTMYGYKVTKPLESSDFTNRQYFNYVESSISVGGSIPRWLANGIALQLMNGVRVWHVLPNRNYYTNNPIVTP